MQCLPVSLYSVKILDLSAIGVRHRMTAILGGFAKMNSYDVVIVGGGPAGLAAAVAARDAGCERILIL